MAAPRQQRPPTRKEPWDEFCDRLPPERPEALSSDEYRALSAKAQKEYDAARLRHHASLGPYAFGSVREVLDGVGELMDANADLPAERIRPAAAIDGQPTLGKTTLLRRMGRTLHRKRREEFGEFTEDGNEYYPVAYVTLPRDSTIRGLNQKVADFYGLVLPNRDSIAGTSARITDAMWRCGTEVVLVDDLHFIQPRQLRGKEVNDHFKHLMNEAPVTFVFAGVGLEEAGFFVDGRDSRDQHLAQLGQRLRHFPIARLDIHDPDDRKQWGSLAKAIEADLCLANRPRLSEKSMATYLYERTQGSVGSLMELIRLGARRAVEAERAGDFTGLTPELLRDVQLPYAAERQSPKRSRARTTVAASKRRAA